MAEERTSFLGTIEPKKLERKVQAVAARVDDIEAKPEPKAAPVFAGGVTWIKPVSVWTVSVTGSNESVAGSFSNFETIDFSREIGGANTVHIEIKMNTTRVSNDGDETFLAIDWRLSVKDDPIHIVELSMFTESDEQRETTKYSTHFLPVVAGKAEIRYKRPSDTYDYEIRVYGYQ